MCQQSPIRKWSTFYEPDKSGFTESFMREMAMQLKLQFEKILDKPNCVDEYGFNLVVGIDSLQLTEKDKCVYANVMVTDPWANPWIENQRTRHLSCYWKSNDFDKPLDIHRSDISAKKVAFYWAEDFPKEDFIKMLNPALTWVKSDTTASFDLEIYLDVYPPNTYEFQFVIPPTKKELRKINRFFQKYQTEHPTFLYSELTDYEDNPRFFMDISLQIPEWSRELYLPKITEILKRMDSEIHPNNIQKIRVM